MTAFRTALIVSALLFCPEWLRPFFALGVFVWGCVYVVREQERYERYDDLSGRERIEAERRAEWTR